jgi:hypothetical protein
MRIPPDTMAAAREFLAAAAIGTVLAIVMTWPLVTGMGHLGRTGDRDADGQFSIWNVAWVARTIVADPAHLFDANIYFPHRRTLAYSEANLVEGALAVPVYWLTRNPWAALNVIMLFAFASAYVGAYLLLRHLSSDPRAAAAGAVSFAFCPFVFAHLSHIQLLMTAGIPVSMLLLHRLADRPSAKRGIALGFALAVQALACAYYGIFAGLGVGYAALLLAVRRRLWRAGSYWRAIALAAATSILVVTAFFIPFLEVRAETGFERTLDDAAKWSANWPSYLASAAHAHGWLLDYISRGVKSGHFDPWIEVLFPGIFAVVFGALGVLVAARAPASDDRVREAGLLYGTLAVVAFWASFGPSAGLYRALYYLPAFSFLRAPSRIGVVVVLCLAVLASLAIARLLRAAPQRWQRPLAVALFAAALADTFVAPLPFVEAPALARPYAVLAKLPRGAVAEFPFYGEREAYPLHSQYMLFSTSHWMPIVNGYSDVIPDDFRPTATILDSFPSRDAFAVLAHHHVRYIGIHWDMYAGRQDEIRERLKPFAPNLRLITGDERMSLYEIVSFP